MIDLHCHLLPGVDDGAKSIQDSIKMIEIALDEGITTMVATPHYIDGIENSSYDDNKVVLENLKEEVDKRNLKIDLLLGNEMYLTNNIDVLIEEGKAASLNKSKYVLIEFPMLDIPNFTENIIYNLQLKGYTPVIAHPERNAKISSNPNILYDLINKGYLAQLNLNSLIGKYGADAQKTSEILVTHNMIHFLGTDAHSPRGRSPKVKESLEKLSQMVEKECFDNMHHKNAIRILKNEDLPMYIPLKYEEKVGRRGFFKRILGIK